MPRRHALVLTLLLAGLARPASAADPAPAARWYAVQLHAHSRYSDGWHPIGDLVLWAKEGGLDAIAITDHNTRAHLADPVYRQDNGITLIPAYEWTETMAGPHTKAAHDNPKERCHISVWGVKPDTPILSGLLTRDQMVAASAGLGVTLGANHPFEPRFPWPDDNFHGVSTMEVWQWQYGYDEVKPGVVPADFRTPHNGLLQASFLLRNGRALAEWQHVLRTGQHLTPVAVADFHLGGPIQQVTSPCTLIWSRSRSVDDLLAGLRAGHVCLAEAPHAPRVELWANSDGDGAFVVPAGDTVPVGAHLQVRVTGGRGRILTVYDARGTVLRQQVPTDPYQPELAAARPGFYWARLDRQQDYNSLVSMTGALYVSESVAVPALSPSVATGR